jgi:hypothetical protein
MADLSNLERRVQVLEDIEAIKQLKAKYLRCVDRNLWGELEECFVEDAEAHYGENLDFEGRKAILDFLKGTIGQESFICSHECHLPEIEVTGDTTARATWKLHDYLIIQPNSTMTGWAYYDEECVKVNGVWKIKVIGYRRDFEEWDMKKPG